MTAIVYVAGPFAGATPWDVAQNVREAEVWGLSVAQAGAMPLIPHANTHLFVGQCTEAFWYAGTLELLRRCDGMLVFARKGPRGVSAGVAAEIAEAQRLGIPILDVTHDYGTALEALWRWVRTLEPRAPVKA